MRLSLRRFGTLGGTVVPTFSNGIVGPTWKPASDSTTAIQIQQADGTAAVTVDTTNRRVGIRTAAPAATLHVIDPAAGTILVGNAEANSTNKTGRVGVQHYNTAEEPVIVVGAFNANGSNTVDFGGGSSVMNTATTLRFYTAANSATVTGTVRLNIDSSGRIAVGTQTQSAWVDIQAGTTAIAQMRFRDSTAPSSPNKGDWWFDGTNLKFYDGSVTRTINWT